MAVSKRTRYEVLRRDNHTCRYCGAQAPDVKLTVDHVTPVALGGTDDPSNLVAACSDCNAGKASSNPDGELVANISDEAMRYAELTRQAYAVLVERIAEREGYVGSLLGDLANMSWLLPVDAANTISRWYEMGVPYEILEDAARTADRNQAVAHRNRFKYMCGIVWNQVRAITEEAWVKRVLDGAWFTEEDRDHLEYIGYDRGRSSMVREHQGALLGGDLLERFIDSRLDVIPDDMRMGV